MTSWERFLKEATCAQLAQSVSRTTGLHGFADIEIPATKFKAQLSKTESPPQKRLVFSFQAPCNQIKGCQAWMMSPD